MLNKVLKKMQELEKIKQPKDKKKMSVEINNKIYPTSKLQKGTGFHAKANSQEGAERQRSMGNRLNKPAR